MTNKHYAAIALIFIACGVLFWIAPWGSMSWGRGFFRCNKCRAEYDNVIDASKHLKKCKGVDADRIKDEREKQILKGPSVRLQPEP